MAVLENQTKSATRQVNYLRHGVMPVMAQVAAREFVDVAFIDDSLMSQITFTELVATALTDQTKSPTPLANVQFDARQRTLDEDMDAWDASQGDWDNPHGELINLIKHTAVLANLPLGDTLVTLDQSTSTWDQDTNEWQRP